MLTRVDLLVANEHVQPTRCFTANSKPQPILYLGSNNLSQHPFFLAWPLQPNQLENQLNRLGELICEGTARVTETAGYQKTAPAALLVEAVPAEPPARHYRLRQWPKPMLLSAPGRMRLATLITGKAMSLEEIVFRSALPKQACESFVADMQTAGLLVNADAPANQAEAWVRPGAVKPRLAAREERQMGSPSVHLTSLVPSVTSAKHAVQPGLIARIRLRFGIQSAKN